MTTNNSIYRNSTLLTLGISESVSSTGNWIAMMAVFALIVFRGGGGVAQTSGVFLAGLLPTLIFSPIAGWLVDHYNRRSLMIVSELCSAVVICGLIFATQIEWVYTLLALQAVAASVLTPARQAVVPTLVGRERLTAANAFLQQLNGIVKIGAPIAAGGLLAVLEPHQAIILTVGFLLLSAAILTRLPALPAPERRSASPQHDSLKARRLFETLKHNPGLALLFGLVFLVTWILIGFDVLAPVFIRDVLAGQESLFGLLIGLIGVGTLLSALTLAMRKSAHKPWRDLLAGIALLALIPGSLGLATGINRPDLARRLVLAGCLMGGMGNGLLTIQAATLLQTLSPQKLLGRISGVYQSIAIAGQFAGIVLTPLLVPTQVSLPAYFAISTALLLALLVVSGSYLLKSMDRLTPEWAQAEEASHCPN